MRRKLKSDRLLADQLHVRDIDAGSRRDAARDHYRAQPAIQAIQKGQQTLPLEQRNWLIDDALSGAREDYVAAAEARAGVPYAVVLDGQWLDSDTVDQEIDADWNRRFRAILDRVPDEAMVTIVDCHV